MSMLYILLNSQYDPEHEKAKAQVKKLQKYRMPILILKSDNDIDVFRTL